VSACSLRRLLCRTKCLRCGTVHIRSFQDNLNNSVQVKIKDVVRHWDRYVGLLPKLNHFAQHVQRILDGNLSLEQFLTQLVTVNLQIDVLFFRAPWSSNPQHKPVQLPIAYRLTVEVDIHLLSEPEDSLESANPDLELCYFQFLEVFRSFDIHKPVKREISACRTSPPVFAALEYLLSDAIASHIRDIYEFRFRNAWAD